jgi:hypothetical protein
MSYDAEGEKPPIKHKSNYTNEPTIGEIKNRRIREKENIFHKYTQNCI